MAEYNRRDPFYQKAKRERFAARSVYKLEEIDQKSSILKKGGRVVDLGCAPGSWLQYAERVVGPSGLILGYDLEPLSISFGSQVRFRHKNVLELTSRAIQEDAFFALKGDGAPIPDQLDLKFDALLSDLAPKTTGIRDADQAKILGLAEHAMALALDLLRPEASFVTKVFVGRGLDGFLAVLKRSFSGVKMLRPKATRDGSRETYVIGRMKN